jgi:hypothetical protein
MEGFSVVSMLVFDSIVSGELRGLPLRLWVLMLRRSHAAGRSMGAVQRVADTQKMMAELLGVHQPDVSNALRELQRLGFVYRAPGDDGRRYWWVDARKAFNGSAKSHSHVLERQRVARRKAGHVAKVVELRSALAQAGAEVA